MTLSADVLADYASTSGREWLCTNGTGSFASGTIASVPTRRYHALLVAALPSPSRRMTVFSHIHETVYVNGVAFDLHTGRYADGTLHPQGWRYIRSFSEFPVPTWEYQFPDGLRIQKRIFLQPGKNTVYISYARIGGDGVQLTLDPLVSWKSYHSEMHPWDSFPTRQGFTENGYEIQATPDAPTLRLLLPGAEWKRAGWWHSHNFHEREAERGQDAIEDLYCPASATIALPHSSEPITLVATIEPGELPTANLVLGDIVSRQNRLILTADIDAENDALRTLVLAADQMVIRAEEKRETIIAGYPWFTDWGRDTFIALPGLCLTTRRYETAREILTAFARYVSEGMIPNRFPDAHGTTEEKPDYNTIDGTLWFVHACGAYVHASGDTAFRAEMAPTLREIIDWHERGTRYGIHVDAADGLLQGGEPGTQLTWMDAKVGDYVVTPRQGKPVEINALWIHALHVTADFTGDDSYLAKAERAAKSFREKFIRPDGNGLYDLIRPDGTPDTAIRPNQIIAAALPTSPLPPSVIQNVVDTVTRELWTPYGLRTLSPTDPAYRPHYEGDQYSRDTAYHQGTVWAWLVGAYVDACRKAHGDMPDLSALIAHLGDYGVGGIAEIFDGDSPHHPDGCPWQAWSVAELLRVLHDR